MVCGYTPEEITSDAVSTRFFHDLPSLQLSSIQHGILPNTNLRTHIEHRVRCKLGILPTFTQLYLATGLDLVVVATNITRGEMEIFSRKTHPDMDCVDAVMLSNSIPLVTGTAIYEGEHYADGMFSNPYPIDLYDDGRTPILGLYIEDIYTKQDLTPPMMIYRALQSPIDEIRRRIIAKSSSQVTHVRLESTKHDITGISWGHGVIGELVVSGHETGKRISTTSDSF